MTNEPLIKIADEFIFVIDPFTKKTIVIPKSCWYPNAKFSTDGVSLDVKNKCTYSIQSLLEHFTKSIYIAKQSIIVNGKFFNIWKFLMEQKYFLGENEIIPLGIMKNFVVIEGLKYCNILIDVDNYIVEPENYIIPSIKRELSRCVLDFEIDDAKFTYDELRQKLIDGGYLKKEAEFYPGNDGFHSTGGVVSVYYPGFVYDLMKDWCSTIPREVKIEHKHEIVGFRRDGKKTITIFSNGAIHINTNDESPDPKLPTIYENIVVGLSEEHMKLITNNGFHDVKFADIKFIEQNSDGGYCCILGNLEVLRVHLGCIGESALQKFDEKFSKKMEKYTT